MQHTHDQNNVASGRVKNEVLAVNAATDSVAVVRPRRGGQRIPLQHVKNPLQSARVGFGRFFAKGGDAVLVNFGEVGERSGSKLQVSHAARGAWR